MGLTRENLERQLSTATKKQEAREAELDANNVTAKDRSKDPTWRNLDANRRQLKSRLRAVEVVEKREADLAAAKSEAAQAE